ncbi:MAG: L,D-transpeptidase family protein [Methyloceanibacter sp.]
MRGPVWAEDAGPVPAAPKSAAVEPVPATPTPASEPKASSEPTPSADPASATQPQATQNAPPTPADPVVASIRTKFADADLRKDAHADDLAALESFYGARTDGPLWMTEMGFSAKAQAALFEIEKAEDWGLDAGAFALPEAGLLPPNLEAQAVAELKLDLAILKYARHARGGRLIPVELNSRFDLVPPLRDPTGVLAEIGAADAPDIYLRSLHPKHEQFTLLRAALLKARGKGEKGTPKDDVVGKGEGAKDDEAAKKDEAAKNEPAKTVGDTKPSFSEKEIKRLILNMERWRWMPEDLGAVHVVNNSPEFMLYVVKDGKKIYADKTLVGTLNYATPIFAADMATIVFNPDWNAPQTVVVENLLPHLSKRNYGILKSHKLSVSYNGAAVDVRKVNWTRSNVLSYTFTQKAGPTNVLGKIKFLYPNAHTVYMHDTLPYRRKVFKQSKRAIGHECVRMEKPLRFAEVLLAEGNGWPASKVKNLWDKGLNSPVTLERKIPVHTTYFTAVVDETGKVETFADLYGFDNKLATALFGNATDFPMPPPEPKKTPGEVTASAPANRTAARDGIASSVQGFLGD